MQDLDSIFRKKVSPLEIHMDLNEVELAVAMKLKSLEVMTNKDSKEELKIRQESRKKENCKSNKSFGKWEILQYKVYKKKKPT